MTRWLVTAGIALIFLGVILVIAGGISSKSTDVEGGGVIFIGPIPIIFGSSRKMALTAGLIGAAVFLFFLFRYWV